jgi:hypothetical protein
MAWIDMEPIRQTDIDDAANDKLCLALTNIQLCGSILIALKKRITPFSLAEVNAIIDKSIKNGGLKTKDGVNSDGGYVLNHEKMAEACGLPGYKKHYARLGDGSELLNRLQWKVAVELRDEGKHSLIACGWHVQSGKVYVDVFDPWPKTDDSRFDLARAMTQRQVNGKWVDSRSIEYIGYYNKAGTNWFM